MQNLLLIFLVGTAGAALAQKPTHAPTPRYSLTDLGVIPNIPEDIGLRIDAEGRVSGWYQTDTGAFHACLWVNGKRTDLGALPDYPATYAADINAKGQIVGLAKSQEDLRFVHAFLWEKGKLRDLTWTLGGKYASARGINAAGQVVGAAMTAEGMYHAVLWREGNLRDLGLLPGGNFSLAQGINRAGAVVGAANITPNGKNHAFLWKEGKMRDLGFFPGGTTSHARAIADNGQIIGWSDTAEGETHSFLWQNGTMTDLGTLGNDPCAARGLNNRGQIVGNAAASNQKMHAFLWEKGKIVDLNALIPKDSGWLLRFAYGINDRGQIVGAGVYQGYSHAFVLTPLASTNPSVAPKTAAVSEAIPFTLTDLQGKTRALADYRGRSVTLCFYCGCEWCHECARLWGTLQRSGALPGNAGKMAPKTLIVFLGDADGARAFAAATGLDTTQTVFLTDSKLSVASRYKALPCPRLFVLDARGTIRYVNDHVDDAPQKAPAATIITRAVDALRQCAANTSAEDRVSHIKKGR